MADAAANTPQSRTLDVRLSVPAGGDLRRLAGELAAKMAEDLGAASPDAQSLSAKVEGLASRLGNGGGHQGQDITFDFRIVDRELVVEARCNGEASVVRHPLPA